MTIQAWSTGRVSWTPSDDTRLVGYFSTCPAVLSADPSLTMNSFLKNPQDGVSEQFAVLLGAADHVNGDIYPSGQVQLNIPIEGGRKYFLFADQSFGTGIVQLYLEPVQLYLELKGPRGPIQKHS